MSQDLRSFLDLAAAQGHLVRLSRPVDPDTQAAALLYELERHDKVGLFEHIAGKSGRLVGNLVGRRDLLALAMGVHPAEFAATFADRLQRRIPPRPIQGPAPVQEVVLQGDTADLTRLPLIVHATRDAAAYITAGIVIAHDPRTGRRNVSINRMQLKGPRKMGIRMMPPQQLGVIQSHAEADSRPLPIAVAIGNFPLDLVAAATTLPFGDDELGLAGALRGEPVPMTRGVSVDLDVPARAELVLEGYVEPNVREAEGPFGDFLQFYVPVMDNHVFRLTAVTHRQAPILQAIHAGSKEDVNLLGISREAQVMAAAVATGAHVCGVRLLPTILGCAISIEQKYQGEAKNAGMAALGAYRWLKYCIVVDHDVNVDELDDVWWAVSTRSNPSDAITVVDRSGGFPRDPFGVHNSKALIDATIPLGEWSEFERKVAPGAATVRLEDFL
ncbi:MAG: UbiD family decarboxylase [Chloroflexi bacterium]|nr:UbiD family decarboxylase [Chloroflexota bacterium]MBV9601090.1 UbiD family decarboxylase [Chloroflexota bacterium]